MSEHGHDCTGDEPTMHAFRHTRRLAESEQIPHGSAVRPSTPPSYCGWSALEFCQGRHPLSVTWLPPHTS